MNEVGGIMTVRWIWKKEKVKLEREGSMTAESEENHKFCIIINE